MHKADSYTLSFFFFFCHGMQNLVYCLFLCLFWPCLKVCGILVSRAVMEPVTPAVEAGSSNHWTTREAPLLVVLTRSSLLTWDGEHLFRLICHR